MAEGDPVTGTQLRAAVAEVDRTIESVHDEAKPPRAGSCSLPRSLSSLKASSMYTASKKQDYISYVRAWIRHASGTRKQNLHLELVVA